VLSGSIRVQNFHELSFENLNTENDPYLVSDYSQDQYTWLSEESFGIHRLINIHPQTCLTLQAYYHNSNTAEFFSVVREKEKKHEYVEYYPQNDWKNYLELVNGSNIEKSDKKFIEQLINKYNLRENGSEKINTSFQSLVMTLRKEYDYFQNRLKI
jgi:hypothetical protein